MWHVLMFLMIQSHRIHGAAIYGNMDPINIPPMLAYIAAPWILWDIHVFRWFKRNFSFELRAIIRSARAMGRRHRARVRRSLGAQICSSWHQLAPGCYDWIMNVRMFQVTAVKFLNLLWSCYRCGLRNWLLNTFSWDQGLKTYVMLCWMVCKPRTRYPICSSVPNGNRHRLKIGWPATLKVKQRCFLFEVSTWYWYRHLGHFCLSFWGISANRAGQQGQRMLSGINCISTVCSCVMYRHTDILIMIDTYWYIYIYIYIMRLSMSQYVVWFISILVWSTHVNTVPFWSFWGLILAPLVRHWEDGSSWSPRWVEYVEHVQCIPM